MVYYAILLPRPLVVVLSQAVTGPPEAMAEDLPEAVRSPAAELADKLVSRIPNNMRIALRPFHRRQGALPVEQEIYRLISNAISDTTDVADGRIRVLTRLITEVYDVLQTFESERTLNRMLRNAKADVEIICSANPGSGGSIFVSCEAVDLNSYDSASASAEFVVESAAVELDHGISLLAAAVAEYVAYTTRMKYGRLTVVRFVESETKCPSELGRFVAKRLEAGIRQQIGELVDDDAREEITGREPDEDYRAEGTIWQLTDEVIMLHFDIVNSIGPQRGFSQRVSGGSLPMLDRHADVSCDARFSVEVERLVRRMKDEYYSAYFRSVIDTAEELGRLVGDLPPAVAYEVVYYEGLAYVGLESYKIGQQMLSGYAARFGEQLKSEENGGRFDEILTVLNRLERFAKGR